MKIVLAAKSVYPFHPVGGVQKYVYYFAKQLQKQGIDLEIVAPLDDGKPRTEEYEGLKYTFLKPSIYKYLEYPIGWLGVHRFSYALRKYLKTIDFDILHGFDMAAYQYSKLKHRKPVVAHIFTDNYLTNPISALSPSEMTNLNAGGHEHIKRPKILLSPFSSKKDKRRYWLQYLFKVKPMYQTLINSSQVFYEADPMKEDVTVAFQISANKGSIVPVGVDLECVDNFLKKTSLSRKDIGLEENDIVLLTVNRLAADKGVDKIICALEKILETHKNVKLVIVGGGYQEKELYALIDAKKLNPYIRHFKNVPEEDLYQYYKLSDIYISAFSYPGSSVSTLEAMAASLPIITTAQPWLVGADNGQLIKNNDSDIIATSVCQLIDQGQLKEMGKASREWVKDFDWEPITKKAISVYEKLI